MESKSASQFTCGFDMSNSFAQQIYGVRRDGVLITLHCYSVIMQPLGRRHVCLASLRRLPLPEVKLF